MKPLKIKMYKFNMECYVTDFSTIVQLRKLGWKIKQSVLGNLI